MLTLAIPQPELIPVFGIVVTAAVILVMLVVGAFSGKKKDRNG